MCVHGALRGTDIPITNCVQCFRDKHQIHHDPDHYKVATEEKGMKIVIKVEPVIWQKLAEASFFETQKVQTNTTSCLSGPYKATPPPTHGPLRHF